MSKTLKIANTFLMREKLTSFSKEWGLYSLQLQMAKHLSWH